ncbi:cytochrome d ubiquinol oxidase subunit II [Lacihabitans sp. LS3-19]|uniref:cytochrome d ubiquinol oxidase subunit II n=1 Tax=Lacihabitans sp. LS3-19 TaxID=2487335 RepID=UPI0020CD8E82|nr:cytochrome d ubiquinol oxidase subunit II [Lacihabitans sp. LS3-19]MCP9767126.1 cytochrome d ubiquinol oxidase subunit II [Lacihabitans sp. LS3-19]
MELFWYIVVISMLTIYMLLDGYDFGAGIVHLFFAKKEEDKKAITKAIGPFWDANEVWLIAGGGVLFFAFPTLYASSFSGFYLPLMMILWLLMFRAIGLELRGLIHNSMWFAIWDTAFGVASLLLALFFGIAVGNIVRGVNMGDVVNGVSTYEAHYFTLPLWNPSLNPLSESVGVIDWFTLLIGLIGVVALTIHGANWIIYKTNSTINSRLKIIIFKLNFVLLGLALVSLSTWHLVLPYLFDNYISHPIFWIFPLISLVGLGGLFRIKHFKKDGTGFVFSSLFLAGGLASTALSIFPNFIPSRNSINPSLNIYNTAASSYGLNIGLVWFGIGILLVALYFTVQYRIFKGKMDEGDYGEH